jgi:HlyD family secretion protein
VKRAPQWRRWALAAAGVALLLALAWVALRSGPMAPTRVTVAAVQRAAVSPALFGIGTVEARRTYLIGPTAAGRLLQVRVDVGDRVQAGQLLAEMAPVDSDERVAALQAAIARARSTEQAVAAQREDALARQALAAANLRRYADLADRDFISAGALEARRQEQRSADAAVHGADANLAAARQDLTRLAADLAGGRQQRDNLRMVAPAAGLVVSRDAEPGSTVVAGQPVLRLVDPASLWVRVRFDQGRAAGLAVGLPAQIVLRSGPAAALPGRVARVETVSDSVTEERVAQVVFDQLPAGAAIGELAEVTVSLPASAPGLVVANASLRQLGDQTGLWRLEGGSPRFVPVTPGATSLDGRVLVTELATQGRGTEPATPALAEGDQVVVYSEQALDGRRRIQVVDRLAGPQP